MEGTKRQPGQKFTPEEDEMLRQLVEKYGSDNRSWPTIAAQMPGRIARQCKERYTHYLSPKINHNPWTPEEDKLLGEKYAVLGPKWTLIAQFFYGRTDYDMKNRYNQLQRQQQKKTTTTTTTTTTKTTTTINRRTGTIGATTTTTKTTRRRKTTNIYTNNGRIRACFI